MNAKELEKVVLEKGWRFVRQKGSHRIYKHEKLPKLIVIPFHGSKDLSPGVVSSTLKGLEEQE